MLWRSSRLARRRRLVQLLTRHLGNWETKRETPTLAQILGWLNVLLDAHFSQLLLHAPAHELLKRLGTLAARHAQLCASLNTLHGHLAQAVTRHALPARLVSDYSVELSDL